MPEKFTDQLTTMLSLAFAAGVIAFASYKVARLNGLEDPPVTMGLNVPPPKRRIIMDGLVTADPVTTQSLSAPGQPQARPAPAQAFALLAVIDGVAFVEVDLLRGRTLIPVTVGTRLPGGYRVDAIEQHNGRWRLVAGPVRLEQAGQ
jgi:hypothetical protein